MKKFIPVVVIGWLVSCTAPENKQEPPPAPTPDLSFTSVQIADDANLWWGRALADLNGDGILDVALIDNCGRGGWLGYLKGDTLGNKWEKVVVAETSPNGALFGTGDLEVGDMDDDGDIDLIGVEHPGEWADAEASATLFWYENEQGSWTPHNIGTIPSALKDLSVKDLDGDNLPEVITATFNAETLSVFHKGEGDDYQLAWEVMIDNLHEGMDVGDLDGDGMADIAANGYWLPNPGHLDSPWELKAIDSLWFTQDEEHWSRNATKVACVDTDGNGIDEVFISHSEKTGYPLAKYQLEGEVWKKEILLDSMIAGHSLQVLDFDLDGDYEVATGVNRNRAIDIQKELETITMADEFPVYIFDADATGWSSEIINTDGVYNLLAGDLEGDGDIDLIRLTSHNEKDMWLMINNIK
jgi:hypothetical protein